MAFACAIFSLSRTLDGQPAFLVRPPTETGVKLGSSRAGAAGSTSLRVPDNASYRGSYQSTRGGRQEGRAPRVMTRGLARQEHRAKLVKVRVS